MAFNYKLPRKNYDKYIILDDVAAADVVLANGKLTLTDTVTGGSLDFKIIDGIKRKKTSYTAGTANVKTIQFSGGSFTANSTYPLTVAVPYLVNFFGGGKETKAVYTAFTKTISVDGTPTAAEAATAFAAAINADATIPVTAAVVSSTQVTLTADSANGGSLEVSTSVTGATITDSTPWVSPAGSSDIVLSNTLPNLVLAGSKYTTYEFVVRELVPHNSVQGMNAVKKQKVVVYINEAATDFSASITKLDAIIGGTSTAANYLGIPA